MIKVLLVDDEKLILNTLKNSIAWDQYDMKVIGEVTNGLSALEFLKNNLVDLVVTDIKMPHMDGIELVQKIQLINPKIIIIIISSYSDFSLVKQGFKYGALDYILKVDLDDHAIVGPVLSKVQALLTSTNNDLFKLKAYGDKLCYPYQQTLSQIYTYICYIKTHNILFKTHLISLVDGLSLNYTTYDDYVVIALIHSNQSNLLEARGYLLDTLEHLIVSSKLVTYSLCISSILTLDNIQESLLQEQNKCHTLYFYQDTSLNSTQLNICHNPYDSTSFNSKKNALLTCIKQLSRYDLFIKWSEYLTCMKSLYVFPEIFLEEAHNTLSFLVNTLNLYSFDITPLGFHQTNILNLIMGFDTLPDFNDWVNSLFVKINTVIDTQKDYQLNTIFLNYINTNFANPELSLEVISTHLEIPKHQLRKICVNLTHMHFKAYLNHIRIENAKLLLLNTPLKISEIGYRVGYSNIEHFSRSFSKLIGMSPLSFQEHTLRTSSN